MSKHLEIALDRLEEATANAQELSNAGCMSPLDLSMLKAITHLAAAVNDLEEAIDDE